MIVRVSLGLQVLLGMALGAGVGAVFGESAAVLEPLGRVFLRMLLMAAIPLVVANLLAGVAGLSSTSALGRIGARIAPYYIFTTAVALTLGLVSASWFRPGVGVALTNGDTPAFEGAPDVAEALVALVPDNPFAALAQGNIAQIVFFSLLLGVATLALPSAERESLRQVYERAAAVLRKLVDMVLTLAPVGIGALTANTVGQHGAALIGPLAKFVGSVWVAQVGMVVLYMVLLRVLARRSPLAFLRRTAPLYATTAGTCSSLASLAVSMEVAESRLGISKRVYGVTLPLGAQFNKDGTSIMLAVVLLFTAQALGLEFTLAQQVTIVIVGLVVSEGSSGIPGGGLVAALVFVRAFDLPVEVAAMVAGIYHLVDMGSTTVNCMGDLVGTCIVARNE